jgi:cytochrome P450
MLAGLAPEEGPLTYEQEAELVQNIGGILLAGHITTADLIGNGVKLLLDHPEQWQLLCHRPELIPSAIEEIARFDTSVQAFFRAATQEITIGDADSGATLQVPAGTQFLLLYASANRDETVFSNAEQFDITWSASRHLGFGFGVHFCAGAPLARKELEVAFQALTQRLPKLRLASGQTFEHEKTLMFRGYQRLFVEWN